MLTGRKGISTSSYTYQQFFFFPYRKGTKKEKEARGEKKKKKIKASSGSQLETERIAYREISSECMALNAPLCLRRGKEGGKKLLSVPLFIILLPLSGSFPWKRSTRKCL